MISVCAIISLTASLLTAPVDMNDQTSEMNLSRSPATAATTQEGQWLDSFELAQEQARQKKLPLMIHFEADWCGPCRKMKSEVLEQAQVLKMLGNQVVAVRVNSDRHPDIVSKFSVASLPTDVILSAEGKELARYVGGTSISEYVARIERLPGTSATTESSADENLRPCLLVMRDGKMVGLGGYSPVVMQKEKKWVKGSEEFVGSFLGVDYYFQSAEERDTFFANPSAFIPGLHGCDPVELQLAGRAEAGAIEFGAFYKGRLFFFSNRENRQRFNSNPASYAEGLLQNEIQNVEQFPFLKSMSLN